MGAIVWAGAKSARGRRAGSDVSSKPEPKPRATEREERDAKKERESYLAFEI